MQTVPGEVTAGPARPAATHREKPAATHGKVPLPRGPAASPRPGLPGGHPWCWETLAPLGTKGLREDALPGSPRGQSHATLGSPCTVPGRPAPRPPCPVLPPGGAGWTGTGRPCSEPPTGQLSLSPRTSNPAPLSPDPAPRLDAGGSWFEFARSGWFSFPKPPSQALQEDATCSKWK